MPAPPNSNGSQAQATVLTSAQATQLLQRLRSIPGSGGTGNSIATTTSGSATIKIQTIQTNPQTGARQIITIPIQTSSQAQSAVTPTNALGQGKLTVSPMKILKNSNGPTQAVKVVKIASTSLNNTPNVVGIKSVAQPVQVNSSTPTKNNAVNIVSVQSGNLPLISHVHSVQSQSHKRCETAMIDFDAFSDAKRRKTEKGGKGLRHFSMKVCEKVQAKGSTSYNEVADELVSELTDPRYSTPTDQQYDQKNIRRRVYDALNVLMAMNIISKEKKEIRWLGLPTNSVQEANNLEVDKHRRMKRIEAKTKQLQDLILQQIAFKNLVERNKEREKSEGMPTPNSAIQLPFIVVNTSKKTVIDCSISNDKMEYLFNFDDTFEIHDDMEVLKRMGLAFGLERGLVDPENLEKARQMVPRALEPYVDQLASKPSQTENSNVNEAPIFNMIASAVNAIGDQQKNSGSRKYPQQDSDSDVDIN